MPIQIGGKMLGEPRFARAGGTLVGVEEIRFWENGAWNTAWQGRDPIERLNPRHYYQLNGSWVDYMGLENMTVNSSRATVGAEFATFRNYSSSRYAEVRNLPGASVGDSVTLAFWINMNSDRNYPTFFGRGPGRNDGYEAYWGSSGGINVGDGENNDQVGFPGGSLVGSWNHLVFRFANTSTSTTHIKVWQNGESLGEQSIGARMRPTSSHPLRLGSSYTGDYPFVGDMDTVAYFDQGLTDAEVLSIYNAGRL